MSMFAVHVSLQTNIDFKQRVTKATLSLYVCSECFSSDDFHILTCSSPKSYTLTACLKCMCLFSLLLCLNM